MNRYLRFPTLAAGLHWLCGFGIVGVAAELALSRHWKSWTQGLSWLAVVLLAWAWWRVRRVVDARGILSGGCVAVTVGRRTMAGVAIAASIGVLGIWMHVHGNYEAGPLDATFGRLWEATALWRQWWLALTMRVGPAPALASGVLALLAGMLWLVATRPGDAD